MKKIIVFLVVMLFSLSVMHTKCDERNIYSFDDVSKSDWYYTAVTELVKNDIIPVGKKFCGDDFATRGEIVQLFYNLNKHTGGKLTAEKELTFDDVPKDSTYYKAVSWAAGNGIISGHDDGLFYPDDTCEREQMCAMTIRYFDLAGIKAKINSDAEQFADSLEISDFARSYIAAARLCGLVIGDENGFFNPHLAITKAECASIVYKTMEFQFSPETGDDYVKTDSESYKYLYSDYRTVSQYLFEPYAEKSEKVELPFFDDAVMVGDSVTMSLQFYCASSGALGNVKFLCAGSLSPVNAMKPVSSSSLHPAVNGVKKMLADSVATVGAKNVYVMLGVNSLYLGVDVTLRYFETLVDSIVAKSPDANILVQSVTPMTSTSPIRTDIVNNENINEYNRRLLSLCKDKGWYFINVAEAVADENGALKDEYCSDPEKMGIHFSTKACKAWAEYLKTHVPEDLR